MGPTTTRAVEGFARTMLKLARQDKHLTQRELAAAAGVPHTTIAKIESGARQPSWPVLCRILAAVDLEPRVRLTPYDNHDDVLDATEARLTAQQRDARDRAQDGLLADARAS
ncbi:MAG: helix-turn-helix domain-containing protein [Sciscionella sp.]